MKSPKAKHPEINNPAVSNPASSNVEDPDAANFEEDKSMPSQSGGNQSKNSAGAADTKFNKFLTNEKKYGGKPPGDESIANRGVTKAKANKDKAI